MDIFIYLRYYINACVYFFFLKWGSIGCSPGIVQWDFTRRDHPGNPGRVFGSGLVIYGQVYIPEDEHLEQNK